METSTHAGRAAPAHGLDLRVLRFRSDPGRDEPAMLAQALLQQGRHAEAVELTATALEEDPGDADLLLTHGVALSRGGRLEMAQLALMRAARAEPGWVEPWRHLAGVLIARGRPEQALGVVERGLSLQPDDEELTRSGAVAELLLRGRRYAERPTEDVEPAMLAQRLIAAGHPGAAFEVTRAALLEELDDEDLLVTHARAARALGDLEEAASVLSTATVAAPDWPEVWRLLAEVHRARGDLQPARDAARRALAAAPDDAEVRALCAALDRSPERA